MRSCVIGGDRRNIELIKLLSNENINVTAYGLEDSSISCYLGETFEETIRNSDKIVLGIPFSKDGETLNASLKISITYLINQLAEGQNIYGGIFSEDFVLKAKSKCVNCFDFMKYEEFAILNTIPTVEGAIALAVQNTDITIHNAEILVLGYGRIGKLLSKILNDMCAKVSVSARKEEDFAWIDVFNYKKIKYSELFSVINKFDIIFNTIPYMILNKECLDRVNKECCIIDLASKPGGVDFEYADKLGIKVSHALGLPGKVACTTAAKYMLDIILKK